MKLFNAIEKCFPEMRKHRDWLWAQHPAEYWKDEEHLFEIKEELKQWIAQRYLDESSMIYQLFWMAGVKSKRLMASQMLSWHICDWNIEHQCEKLSQTDTSPARE